MRIDNKYFPAFMAILAVISAILIVLGSLSFKNKESRLFMKSIAENDSLTTKPMLILLEEDSLTVDQFQGKDVVVLFFSSWSGKSRMMIEEINTLADQNDNVQVIGAIVRDALEAIDFNELPKKFAYVDGVPLYNELKVPGVPSYILFDENGNYKYAHIGYQKDAGYSLLKSYIDE